jgi:hypothetical protein
MSEVSKWTASELFSLRAPWTGFKLAGLPRLGVRPRRSCEPAPRLDPAGWGPSSPFARSGQGPFSGPLPTWPKPRRNPPARICVCEAICGARAIQCLDLRLKLQSQQEGGNALIWQGLYRPATEPFSSRFRRKSRLHAFSCLFLFYIFFQRPTLDR